MSSELREDNQLETLLQAYYAAIPPLPDMHARIMDNLPHSNWPEEVFKIPLLLLVLIAGLPLLLFWELDINFAYLLGGISMLDMLRCLGTLVMPALEELRWIAGYLQQVYILLPGLTTAALLWSVHINERKEKRNRRYDYHAI